MVQSSNLYVCILIRSALNKIKSSQPVTGRETAANDLKLDILSLDTFLRQYKWINDLRDVTYWNRCSKSLNQHFRVNSGLSDLRFSLRLWRYGHTASIFRASTCLPTYKATRCYSPEDQNRQQPVTLNKQYKLSALLVNESCGSSVWR
jgi:hypothetical protein